LRWVPYRISDLQKQTQIIMSKEWLKLLESMRNHSWKYRKMLDEAWFYFSIEHESIWLSPEDEALQRESRLRRWYWWSWWWVLCLISPLNAKERV
jgi:hypothetical protein